jgi:hypothetical protein
MRVRTGRLEKLRLAETGYPEAIEVGNGQHSIQSLAAVAPPAAAVCRHLAGSLSAGPERAQFAIDGRAAFPVLKLKCPQPMAQPLVQLPPDPRRLRQSEVAFPTPQIDPQPFHRLR